MYKSPIEIKIDDIVSDAVERVDKYIVRYIQQVGVNVDKDELTKALKFDREQYEKGWNDRGAEIVRCKDCKYCTDCITDDGMNIYYRCLKDYEKPPYCSAICPQVDEDDYCSMGERRKDETC